MRHLCAARKKRSGFAVAESISFPGHGWAKNGALRCNARCDAKAKGAGTGIDTDPKDAFARLESDEIPPPIESANDPQTIDAEPRRAHLRADRLEGFEAAGDEARSIMAQRCQDMMPRRCPDDAPTMP